jgi:hypothetical protein
MPSLTLLQTQNPPYATCAQHKVLAIISFMLLIAMLDLHIDACKTRIGDACGYFNERGSMGG